jgi:hypothetical protein
VHDRGNTIQRLRFPVSVRTRVERHRCPALRALIRARGYPSGRWIQHVYRSGLPLQYDRTCPNSTEDRHAHRRQLRPWTLWRPCRAEGSRRKLQPFISAERLPSIPLKPVSTVLVNVGYRVLRGVLQTLFESWMLFVSANRNVLLAQSVRGATCWLNRRMGFPWLRPVLDSVPHGTTPLDCTWCWVVWDIRRSPC